MLAGKIRDFEFTPPGEKTRYLAVASPLKLGEQTFGAIVVAKPKAALHEGLYTVLLRLAIAFAVGVGLVAGARVVPLAADHASRCSRSRAPPTRSPSGHYDVDVSRVRRAAARSATSPTASREMALRLDEAEELERNFLMSVSHELRTPLTAIRGHVDALREGVDRGSGAARASLDVIADEADRLERLVGDVLDLAKLDARPVHAASRRRSTWSASSSRRTRRSARRRAGAGSTTAGRSARGR